MAISNYTELKAAVANWLDRDDLNDRIPEFIRLAELDIARNLRKQVLSADLTLDGRIVTLPADVAELRVVTYFDEDRVAPLTNTSLANLLALGQAGSGLPTHYAISGGKLYLNITPDTDYAVVIVYDEALVPLSDTATTNATLTAAPDLYLFAALKEAELYLEHDERNIVWASKYQKAINDENIARERAELAAPAVMGLPTVFG